MNCQYCNKETKSKVSCVQHEIRCHANPNRLDMTYSKSNFKNTTIPPTPCVFCQKIYETKSALSNHIRRCPQNPNRTLETLTNSGRMRLSLKGTEANKKKWSDPIFREKHRSSMQRAVQENPESYTSSNRGRVKQFVLDGIKFQGQWEVDFYIWAKQQGLNPSRPSKAFKYYWNGERWYHPDFYIQCKDLYVEVKGYETDRDKAKWSQFPEKLCIIKEKEIKQIRNNTFPGL